MPSRMQAGFGEYVLVNDFGGGFWGKNWGWEIADYCTMSGEIFVKDLSGGTGSAAGGAEFAKGNESGEIADATGCFYLDIGW